ncbi:protein-tyrosine-phosphatase [Niastella caeni]|uniref:Protein-tyrosine-phosphatase n=2 Tax=Niastella caeni TaxID=2569763 RepID=A0A4S8HVX2_9BACT|nr:protein-tyrosine-phosphatase [Niastella caeni]
MTNKPKANRELSPVLNDYIENAKKDFDKIPADRKEQLKKIASYVQAKLNAEKKAGLIFICTHNSRRSHMGQLWAYAAANYYGIKGISSFSGGTEATAFHPNAIKALTNAGFSITKKGEGSNPKYEVKYAADAPAVTVFSKKYMDAPNPTTNFVAIMTCSQANEACPVVHGASVKIAIPYEDPKQADGKPNQDDVYNERCRQIATEILYAFSLVKDTN